MWWYSICFHLVVHMLANTRACHLFGVCHYRPSLQCIIAFINHYVLYDMCWCIDDTSYTSASQIGWSNGAQDIAPIARANMASLSYLTRAGCWRAVIAGGEGRSDSPSYGKVLPITPAWFELQQSIHAYIIWYQYYRARWYTCVDTARVCDNNNNRSCYIISIRVHR